MTRAFKLGFMTALTLASLSASSALAQDPVALDADEAELMKSYGKVDVWHFPVDYTVAYNNQDVVTTRQLVAQPAPAGKLCYIRFDLLRGEGEYSYGFKPAALGEAQPDVWGVYVKKLGTVLSQARSVLKMNVVYFYVDELKKDGDSDICQKKQSAQTAQAGHAFKNGEWSDLIVRAKLFHGWPQQRNS